MFQSYYYEPIFTLRRCKTLAYYRFDIFFQLFYMKKFKYLAAIASLALLSACTVSVDLDKDDKEPDAEDPAMEDQVPADDDDDAMEPEAPADDEDTMEPEATADDDDAMEPEEPADDDDDDEDAMVEVDVMVGDSDDDEPATTE